VPSTVTAPVPLVKKATVEEAGVAEEESEEVDFGMH